MHPKSQNVTPIYGYIITKKIERLFLMGEPTQPNIRILMFDLKKQGFRFQQHAFPHLNTGFHDTSSDSTDVYWITETLAYY
jgi:hypothetical protein